MDKLAIDGGKPVRDTFLPFHRPNIGKEEEDEVIDTLRSGWLTKASKTIEFEKMFADYCEVKHAVGLINCTAGLHLALIALNVGKGDEVITTPMTFAATANSIVNVGATPVFVDIDPTTLNIDTGKIEEKITERTKAILPVHFSGQPCEMDDIVSLAKEYGLVVIEDAAHAVGTIYKGRKVGGIGDASVFSFYANKNMTTGEGGMLTTNNDETAEKVSILSLHGLSADAWKRFYVKGFKHYDVLYPGYNYHMFDIQASLGIHQLKKVDKLWENRKRIVDIYNGSFEEFPEISLIPQIPREGSRNSYYLYIIALRIEKLRATRDMIASALQAENIGVGVHYKAVHLQPYYRRSFGFEEGQFPTTEYYSERVISLPLFPTLTDDDVGSVVSAVKKVVSFYKS